MKTRWTRTAFGLALAAVMTLGLLHVSATPAEAGFTCPPTFLGCTYVTTYYDDETRIACCIYQCPDGSERVGPSWIF